MNRSILNAVIILLLLIAILSGSILLWYTCQRSDEKYSIDTLRTQIFMQNQEKVELSHIPQKSLPIANDTVVENLNALKKQNQDLAAWIRIPGTQIDYPVMHTPSSPQYYLRKNFEKKASLSGLLFIQETCSLSPQSNNIIIHGHNMKDGTMLSELHQYRDENFWKEHPIIDFYTMAEKQTYEIIGVIDTMIGSNAYEFALFADAGSETDFTQFMNEMKQNSLYDTEIEAIYGDLLLTLSTCSNKGSDSRLLVIAKRSLDSLI